MRRGLAVAAAAAVVLLGAGPAVGDDDLEIDERLEAAGYRDAYTGYLAVDGDDGERVVVVLDYVTEAGSPAAYRQEAEQAAGLVWEHLEYRVDTVVVAPTNAVTWTDGEVPSPVAMGRDDLERALGARPSGLDDEGAGFYGSGGDAVLGVGVVVAAVVLVGGGAVAGYLVGRARGRRAAAASRPGQAPWSTSGPSSWPPAEVPGSQWSPGGPSWDATAPPSPSGTDPWRPS